MKRLSTSTLLAALLVLSVAAPAAADSPGEFSITETFADVDPCSGLVHEVTIAATFEVHEHQENVVAQGVRTLTTTAGYSGNGTSAFVTNKNVEVFRFGDVLSDGSGNRIRASGVFVFNSAQGTVKVAIFELSCLGS